MEITRHDGSPVEDGSIVFVGDWLPSREQLRDPLHDRIRDILAGAEISVANLEAPLKAGHSLHKPGPVHSVPDATPDVLASNGFNAVTLATNHMMDYGMEGLRRTLARCHANGLQTVGAGEDLTNAWRPLTCSVSGTEITIFNLAERWSGFAQADSPGFAWLGDPGLTRRLRKSIANTDVCIVVLHGGVGYSPLPSPSLQAQARSFVDLGADAIVAHHPHVAQGWETYQGAPIFYSLGNFLFTKPIRPSTHWTCNVKLTIRDDQLHAANVFLTRVEGDTVQLLQAEDGEADYWNHLETLSRLTQEFPDNRGHWQEIATRLYDRRYEDNLQEFGCGPLQTLLRFPEAEMGRLLSGVYPGVQRKRQQQMSVLNQVQTLSIRDVVRDALSVRTGATTDHRSEHIALEVDELMRWTDEYPLPTTTEKWRYRLQALYRNLDPT